MHEVREKIAYYRQNPHLCHCEAGKTVYLRDVWVVIQQEAMSRHGIKTFEQFLKVINIFLPWGQTPPKVQSYQQFSSMGSDPSKKVSLPSKNTMSGNKSSAEYAIIAVRKSV